MHLRFSGRLRVWSKALVALPVAVVLSGCAGGSGSGVNYTPPAGGGNGGNPTNLNYTGSGSGIVTSLSGPNIPKSSKDFSFAISVSSNVITITPIAAAGIAPISGGINASGKFQTNNDPTKGLVWSGTLELGSVFTGTLGDDGGDSGTFTAILTPTVNPNPTALYSVASGTGTLTITGSAVDLTFSISNTGAITITPAASSGIPAVSGDILTDGDFALTYPSGTHEGDSWTGKATVTSKTLTVTGGTLSYLTGTGIVKAPFTLTGTVS